MRDQHMLVLASTLEPHLRPVMDHEVFPIYEVVTDSSASFLCPLAANDIDAEEEEEEEEEEEDEDEEEEEEEDRRRGTCRTGVGPGEESVGCDLSTGRGFLSASKETLSTNGTEGDGGAELRQASPGILMVSLEVFSSNSARPISPS